nr:hypothetical protein CFP56_39690 [Quercus suber]
MDAPTQIRAFSKLKPFVHILVGKGLSALSISYILSSDSLKLKEMNNYRKQQKERLRMEMKYPKKQSVLK